MTAKTFNVPVVLNPGDTAGDPNDGFELVPEFLEFKFGKQETAPLIDQVARANTALASITKWVKAAKVILGKRFVVPTDSDSPTINPGVKFVGVYSKRTRNALDQERVKEEMGEEWFALHCKETSYFEMRFKPVGEESGDEYNAKA